MNTDTELSTASSSAKWSPASIPVGAVIDRLMVVGTAERTRNASGRITDYRYLCRCQCGRTAIVSARDLLRHSLPQCACASDNAPTAAIASEKPSGPLYMIWMEISDCCKNPHYELFPAYGGQGINLDTRWQAFPIFREWAQQNGYQNGRYLQRRDAGGDFTPDNCIWVELPSSPKHSGPPRTMLTAFGETKTITDWENDPRCVVPKGALVDRLRHGWSVEEALSTVSSRSNRRLPAKFASIQLGAIFGRLTVISPCRRVHIPKGLRYDYTCRCACGAETVVQAQNLFDGIIVSCGCYHRDITRQRRKYPNGTMDSPLYTIWRRMRDDCLKPSSPRYARFGGLGSQMDAGWQNDFLAFQQWALDNGYAKGKHLIRHNIDGDFTPENCAFVEQETSQMMNKDARILTFFNETKTRAAWLRDARCRVSGGVLDFRLKAGWSPESALSTPPKPSGYRHPEGYTLTTIPVGAQFGKLTVRSAHQRVKYPSGNSEYFYACDCACGTTHHLANANRLLKGTLTSCGCQRGKRYAQPVSGLDRHE